MKQMRRILALLMAVLVLLGLMGNALASTSAGLLGRLATRTGPGTQYDEPGTYFQNSWRTARVQVMSAAWDDYNKIWWVQVDFADRGLKFRAYTGLKRVSVDVNRLQQEVPLGSATMTSAGRAHWGPGRDYVESKYNVPKHTRVSVYGAENGFVHVEFYDARTAVSQRSLRRAWVNAAAVSGKWEESGSSQQAQPGGYNSASQHQASGQQTAYQFCPNCGKELPSGDAVAFCPYCGYALGSTAPPAASTQPLAAPWTGEGTPIQLFTLEGDGIRPQCGPDASYKVFASRDNQGNPLYQRRQIKKMNALFTSGSWVYMAFVYSNGRPGMGFFERSLFAPFAGVPQVQLVPARRGQVKSAVNPFNGPGYHYGEFSSCRVNKGDPVHIFFEEDGWYYCEFYTQGNNYGNVQLWLPAAYIDFI